MVDMIGNTGNTNTAVVCTKQADGMASTSALCDRTDCPSYGKWWCPFTGW